MDLNGVRRKNATRETTSTLKAWLYEHRKNPYPTKGEKIMLAIVTKMTLTQGNKIRSVSQPDERQVTVHLHIFKTSFGGRSFSILNCHLK